MDLWQVRCTLPSSRVSTLCWLSVKTLPLRVTSAQMTPQLWSPAVACPSFPRLCSERSVSWNFRVAERGRLVQGLPLALLKKLDNARCCAAELQVVGGASKRVVESLARGTFVTPTALVATWLCMQAEGVNADDLVRRIARAGLQKSCWFEGLAATRLCSFPHAHLAVSC